MNPRILFFSLIILALTLLQSCQPAPENGQSGERFSYRGWNILSSHRENGLKTLDKAVEYGINHIELSHYQLVHDLKDFRKPENREATNFFIDAAHERGIENVYVWDHAFYPLDYYPDRFKVEAQANEDFTHHTTKFEGGLQQQLNLDDPKFWQWVYQDYDSLLDLSPNLDGIVLTFIETGSYVIYQHSEKLKTKSEKLAALVDSLGGYFIDQRGLKLTIRTFIYNQFEREIILNALKQIKRDDITVMIKMTPHDWFLTYPYQDYVTDIPFTVVIEYDCGMEYAGENLITNTFSHYFADAFRHYAQFDNVVGYCARTDRFEETAAVGTPGELNLFVLSQLAKDLSTDTDSLTTAFIAQTYGAEVVPLLKPAFDSALSIVLSTFYTLGTHTANHSRLNYHRKGHYQTHTTGEWFAPDDQYTWIGHDVNKRLHHYKDILNALSFPDYKTDTAGMRKDLSWVVDSAWLSPNEALTPEYYQDILTEKAYSIRLAEEAMKRVEKALPLIPDTAAAQRLYHTFNRTLIVTKERRGTAQAVFGYRLWCKGPKYRTPELQRQIYDGLEETASMLEEIDNYPVHTPLGQWRWQRDRESFDIYYKAITEAGWTEVGLYEVVPRPE